MQLISSQVPHLGTALLISQIGRKKLFAVPSMNHRTNPLINSTQGNLDGFCSFRPASPQAKAAHLAEYI